MRNELWQNSCWHGKTFFIIFFVFYYFLLKVCMIWNTFTNDPEKRYDDLSVSFFNIYLAQNNRSNTCWTFVWFRKGQLSLSNFIIVYFIYVLLFLYACCNCVQYSISCYKLLINYRIVHKYIKIWLKLEACLHMYNKQ